MNGFLSGKENFNFKLKIFWDKNDPAKNIEKFGVFTDDLSNIYFKSDTEHDGVEVVEKISKAGIELTLSST